MPPLLRQPLLRKEGRAAARPLQRLELCRASVQSGSLFCVAVLSIRKER